MNTPVHTEKQTERVLKYFTETEGELTQNDVSYWRPPILRLGAVVR